jgi:hypothetical protein
MKMVKKKQTEGVKGGKRSRVKVGKLKRDKEAAKGLTGVEAKQIKGGLFGTGDPFEADNKKKAEAARG